jgi:hypothetical protein
MNPMALTALVVILFMGCEYEEPKFEGRREIPIECTNSRDYYKSIKKHLATELEQYQSVFDKRNSAEKYKGILKLFESAQMEMTDCGRYNPSISEIDVENDEFFKATLALASVRSYAFNFEKAEKVWEDSDIEVFRRVLEGKDSGYDLSKLPGSNCARKSEQSDITKRLSTFRQQAGSTGRSCAAPLNLDVMFTSRDCEPI